MPSYNLDIQVDGHDNGAGPMLLNLSGSISGLGSAATTALGGLAKDAIEGVTSRLKGLATDSVKVAGDFQFGMNQFQIAVGQTLQGSGKSLDDFKSLFISLGKELPVSTSEVEQAATEMARGGIDPAVIAADGLKRTIQFAAASLKGDLVGAAQISAKTMQAWTQTTDSAATKTEFLSHAQDLMTQATTAASTTVDQLFLGLSNVGGTARTAGASFDETVTALAQLTPSFASSADAGTSLKTMLSRLIPSTNAAQDEMRRLGLFTGMTKGEHLAAEKAITKTEAAIKHLDPTSKSYADQLSELNGKVGKLKTSLAGGKGAFYDAEGNFIGMAAAAQKLQDATKNLSEEQRQHSLQIIFGQDAIRAAAVLANQGAAGYNALAESIGKQSNVAQAAAIAQTGYNTAWDNLQGSVEALEITLGSAVIPTLTNLYNNVLAPGVNKVTEFADGFIKAGDKTSYLRQGVNDLITAIQTYLVGHLPGWLSTLGQWGDAAWQWLAEATPRVLTILERYGTSILGWATAHLPTWLAALSSWGLAAWQWISNAVPTALAYLLNLRNALIGWALSSLPGWIDTLKGWSLGLLNWISDATPGMLQLLGNATVSLINLVGQKLPSIINSLSSWSLALLNWITNSGPGMTSNMGGFVGRLLDAVGNALPGIVSALAAWGAALVGWVVTRGPDLLANMGGLIVSLGSWIASRIPIVAGYLAGWAGKFAGWVEGVWPSLEVKAGQLFGSVVSWVEAKGPGLISQLGTWASSFIGWIGNVWPQLETKAGQLNSSILSWILDKGPGLVTQLATWGWNFVSWVAPYIPPLLLKLGELFSNMVTWLIGKWPEISSKLADWGKLFGTWVTDTAVPWLKQKLPEVWNEFTTWLSQKVQAAQSDGSLGKAIVDGLQSGISGAWSGFMGFLSGQWNLLVSQVKRDLGIASPSTVFAQIGSWLIDGMWNGLNQGWGRLTQLATNIGMSIRDKIGEWWGAFKDVGGHLVDGLWNGLQSSWQSTLVGPLQSLAAALPQPIRQALGIASPSKVFAELGQWIPPGILQGAQQAMPAAASGIGQLSKQIVGAATPAIGTGAIGAGVGAGSTASGGTTIIYAPNVTVQGSVVSQRDLTAALVDDLRTFTRQNGGLARMGVQL